jgi:hypothetical protein
LVWFGVVVVALIGCGSNAEPPVGAPTGDAHVTWHVSEPADDSTSFTVPALPSAYAAYDATVAAPTELWGAIVQLSAKSADGTLEHVRGANDSKANLGF